MQCTFCRVEMNTGLERYSYPGAGLPFVRLEIKVSRCTRCGTHRAHIPNIEQLHCMLAVCVVQKRCPLTVREIRFLRRWLGLSRGDLARNMDVDPSVVSQWERGSVINETFDRMLRIQTGLRLQNDTVDPLVEFWNDKPLPLDIMLKPTKRGWERVSRSQGVPR